MAFRMSEQPRTIKIYNLLAELMNLLVKVMHIFRLIQVCSKQYDIAPPDIPAGFVAVFNSDESSWHLVEDHRVKRFMT
ncbi:tail fiber chaperone; Qin prophage [Escherichia coli]|nr:tail fiber chaperone; Qin prophage [Escherichia coli]